VAHYRGHVNRARAFHTLTAVVALVALVLQLVQVAKGSVVLVDAHPPGLVDRLLRYFAYFTIQSNILVLVTAAQLAQDPARDGRAWRVVRTAAISGITVTGLVHWFLLRKLLDLHGADYLADRMLHLVVPILAVLGWLVFGPRPRIDWGVCLRAALWPLAWLVVILGQAVGTGWYPYPFLDHDRHGWGYVLGVCVGILVLFFVVFAALREYDRRMRPDPARAGSTAVTGS
jgi:uncharacterized membrane protein